MANAVELSELIRNYAIVVGGAIGIGIALWRGLAASRQATAAIAQSALARRDHATKLFNESVSNLGHSQFEVRLGAIFTLKRIGRDFGDLALPVFELLQAYVREHTKGLAANQELGADIEEVMKYIKEQLGDN